MQYNCSHFILMSFRFLNVNITSFGDISAEVQIKLEISKKPYGGTKIYVETKVKIGRTMIQPMIWHRNQAETKRTRQIMRITELKMLRIIVGVTPKERKISKRVIFNMQLNKKKKEIIWWTHRKGGWKKITL